MLKFAHNPFYVEYECLLRELNQLAAQGSDETQQGEDIQEQLETLHWKLQPEERLRLRGLSADLYMLQGDEVYNQAPSKERTQEILQPLLKACYELAFSNCG